MTDDENQYWLLKCVLLLNIEQNWLRLDLLQGCVSCLRQLVSLFSLFNVEQKHSREQLRLVFVKIIKKFLHQQKSIKHCTFRIENFLRLWQKTSISCFCWALATSYIDYVFFDEENYFSVTKVLNSDECFYSG